MASNFTIDNRASSKLGQFLNDKIEDKAQLSLLLKSFTLIGFELLEKRLNVSQSKLLLSVGDEPLAKTIALPYTQAKKTLDILKKHSLGRGHPDSVLFQQLGSSTQYQSHLKQVIAHIQGKKVEEGMNSLFSRGGTQLDAFNANSDFEVISYLILVDEKG